MMTEISKMSAIELQREIDRGDSSEYSGTVLLDALKEVARLRIICQDIVELINTHNDFIWEGGDVRKGISKIEELAQGYFEP